jgi:acyl-coenzyme A thioesterase PaaI-like protein
VPEREVEGALFERLGDGHWQPTGFARGPWSPDALHGGPVAALLAGVLEATAADTDPDTPMQAARLSVELLRPVPMAPLTTVSEVVRPGRKVRLVDCALSTADGHVVATARLLQIRRAEVPSAPVTTGVEGPAGPEGIPRSRPADVDLHFHSHAIEHRFVAGGFGHFGPATDWMRLLVPVVAGEPPSPLQRVAAAADFGNGISRVADWNLLLFINPDLTIHLHREPEGEWVCLDAVTWMEPHGSALAESRLWDEHGPLGRSLQSLIVDDRAPGGAP